jgi:thiol-disulfide isomerase/thioredoxin
MAFLTSIRLHTAYLMLLMLIGYRTATAQTYSPDLGMSLKEFQAHALTAKDEVWVVDFWATWCGPCIQAIPHMKETHAKFEGKGVRFVSVSWDRNETQWRAGLERFQMPWSHLIVPKGEEAWLEKRFPHKGIPTVFVVSRAGKAKKVNDVYQLEKVLTKVLAQ